MVVSTTALRGVLLSCCPRQLHGDRSAICFSGQNALDERLGRMRARMLQDAALASSAADIKAAQEAERPVCAECGGGLVERTTAVRRLVTQHNQTLEIKRSYGVCSQFGAGVFPPR